MNNEMTLDKAVKLSDEELGTVAGGVTESQRAMVRRRRHKVGSAKDTYRICITKIIHAKATSDKSYITHMQTWDVCFKDGKEEIWE